MDRPGDAMLHLVPAEVWNAQRDKPFYEPDGFGADGYIHCTIGDQRVIQTGNRYYQNDRRPYLALVIDSRQVRAPIRFDDAEQVYPHIYGPLNLDAVIAVLPVERGPDDIFVRMGTGPVREKPFEPREKL